MRRPKYKELYEKSLKELRHLRSAGYAISYQNPGKRDCEHNFSEWTLVSDGGIAFCVWECSICGMEVNQLLGERLSPEQVPTDPSVVEWSE